MCNKDEKIIERNVNFVRFDKIKLDFSIILLFSMSFPVSHVIYLYLILLKFNYINSGFDLSLYQIQTTNQKSK